MSQWKLAVAVTAPAQHGYCRDIVDALHKHSTDTGFVLTKWYDTKKVDPADDEIDYWLRRIKRKARSASYPY